MQSFNAYSVLNYKKGNEKRSKWQKIGVVFEHKDGEGFDVVLSALPINGRIVLRKPKSKEALAALDDDAEDGVKGWFEME